MITTTLLNDRVLKNYIDGTEVGKDLEAINFNKDVVSNLMTMINGCAYTGEVKDNDEIMMQK